MFLDYLLKFNNTNLAIVEVKKLGDHQTKSLQQAIEYAEKYLDESKMAYLVVGDAATQLDQFREMDFDEVKVLDTQGNEVTLPIKLNTEKVKD